MTFRLGQRVVAIQRRRPDSRGVDWHVASVVRLHHRTKTYFLVGLETACEKKFTHRSDHLAEMQTHVLGTHEGDRLCPPCWA